MSKKFYADLQMPYYWSWVNCYWFGFWTAMLYVMLIFFSAVVTKQQLVIKFASVSCKVLCGVCSGVHTLMMWYLHDCVTITQVRFDQQTLAGMASIPLPVCRLCCTASSQC